MSHIVFISYAKEDSEVAEKLYKDLASEGFRPWIDTEKLFPGVEWKPAIRRAIREARFFIILLSCHSVTKRGYVQKEIREALEVLDEFPESAVFMIPARVEPCDVSHQRLADLHWVDLFPSYEDGLAKIVRTLRSAEEEDTERRRIFSKEPPTARLRGDTIGLGGGKKSNPVALVAARREWVYEMARSVASGNVAEFFDAIRDEKGTLVPAGTLVEVLEWADYKELKVVRIKILENELEGWIAWTTGYFIP